MACNDWTYLMARKRACKGPREPKRCKSFTYDGWSYKCVPPCTELRLEVTVTSADELPAKSAYSLRPWQVRYDNPTLSSWSCTATPCSNPGTASDGFIFS